MDSKEISAFVLSAVYGSFSKAAELLFTTQPSVSKMISSLETELGHKLFTRKDHRIYLTEFGEEFLPYARRMVVAEQEARAFCKKGENSQNTIHLFIAESLHLWCGGFCLDPLLSSLTVFHEKYPMMDITVGFYPDSRFSTMLKSNDFDILIFSQNGVTYQESKIEGVTIDNLAAFRNTLLYASDLKGVDTIEQLLAQIPTVSCLDEASENLVYALSSAYFVPLYQIRAVGYLELLYDVIQKHSIGLISAVNRAVNNIKGIKYLLLDPDQFSGQIYIASQDSNQFASEYKAILEQELKTFPAMGL